MEAADYEVLSVREQLFHERVRECIVSAEQGGSGSGRVRPPGLWAPLEPSGTRGQRSGPGPENPETGSVGRCAVNKAGWFPFRPSPVPPRAPSRVWGAGRLAGVGGGRSRWGHDGSFDRARPQCIPLTSEPAGVCREGSIQTLDSCHLLNSPAEVRGGRDIGRCLVSEEKAFARVGP